MRQTEPRSLDPRHVHPKRVRPDSTAMQVSFPDEFHEAFLTSSNGGFMKKSARPSHPNYGIICNVP